jgi:hypothetical protein
MNTTSDMWAGLAMATGLWVLMAVALVSPSANTPKEAWVASSSDRVRSHPTLVRAAVPIRRDPVLARTKGEKVTALSF